MIRCFRIKGFRSFASAEIPLKPLTVVFGPNASGKSNTFDAMRLLQAVATRASLGEAIKVHSGTALEAFRLPESGLYSLLAEKTVALALEADVRLSDHTINRVEEVVRDAGAESSRRKVTEKYLSYSITVEFETATGRLGVKDESLVAIRQDGTRRPGRDPFIIKEGEDLEARMEGQDQTVRYRGSSPGSAISAPFYAPHHPHIAAFREEISRWSFHHLSSTILAADSPLQETAMPGPIGENVAACLHTLKHVDPAEFEELNSSLRDLVPGLDGLEVERTASGQIRLLVREEGRIVPARLASGGTLRVIGLLAVIWGGQPDSVIGLEEPENGVHPARLEKLAAIIRRRTGPNSRQIIMNTHSPLLADLFAKDHLVLCRKTEGATSFMPVEKIDPLFRQPEIERTMNA